MTGSEIGEPVQLSGGVELDSDCILIDAEALDAEDILAQLAERLQREGYVSEGFVEALVARERAFPTGIMTKTLPLALAHAEPEYVKSASLAVAVLREGVIFRQMDDPEQMLSVRLVFLIALPEAHGHVEFLHRFTLAIQTDDFLPRLLTARDASTVSDIVTSELTTVGGTAADDQAQLSTT